ncbi:MAG: DUF1385 domain-containing protein, partial [Clostridia bacterium]|nr:DUF1385 domain-containing protein [Clostridia bacterium]
PMKKTSIGGQALMEGIMMRGPKTTAMAVRNPQGEIVLETFPTVGKERPAILRWPIIRGVVGFIDSMTFGYKCLMRSAEISGLEEIEAEMEKEKAEKKAAKKAEKAAKKAAKNGETAPVAEETPAPEAVESAPEPAETVEAPAADPLAEGTVAPLDGTAEQPTEKKKGSSPMMTVIMVISVIFAMAIAIGLFIVMPAWLYDDVLARFIPWVDAENRFAQSVFEGVLRVLLLIGYMSLMLLMKDIRRTFQFHGAEHKTIFCYEHGKELTVENIREERRFHPRCGTSFLVLMMLVSILVGFFIPATLPTVLRVLCKLAVFPLVMGIGYELIKFCGRHDNWLTRIIAAPGLWFQRITVLEPDDSMIECAIAAMKEAIPDDDSDKI